MQISNSKIRSLMPAAAVATLLAITPAKGQEKTSNDVPPNWNEANVEACVSDLQNGVHRVTPPADLPENLIMAKDNGVTCMQLARDQAVDLMKPDGKPAGSASPIREIITGAYINDGDNILVEVHNIKDFFSDGAVFDSQTSFSAVVDGHKFVGSLDKNGNPPSSDGAPEPVRNKLDQISRIAVKFAAAVTYHR